MTDMTPGQLELSNASAGEIARTLRWLGKAEAVANELGAPTETEGRRLHAHLLSMLGVDTHEQAGAEIGRLHRSLLGQDQQHPDDVAVAVFALAMVRKLAAARAKGRGGWDDESQCEVSYLAKLLVEQVNKRDVDVVDVANLACFLYHRFGGQLALRAVVAERNGYLPDR